MGELDKVEAGRCQVICLSSSLFLLCDSVTGTLANVCYGFYTKNENTNIIYENMNIIYENIFLDFKV